jgi:hypothetical protein
MMSAIEGYLALRRATGFQLSNAEYLLSSFARFAAARNESLVRAETAIAWAAQARSTAQRDQRLKTVCRFARFVRFDNARHELPPANHFGYRKRRRVPHIYSWGEIDRLIQAALQLGPSGSLKGQTYATSPRSYRSSTARPAVSRRSTTRSSKRRATLRRPGRRSDAV